jgi:hypothetical protein
MLYWTSTKVLQPHLFPAHRIYIWAFEKALREECGYTGWQPVSARRLCRCTI